MHEGSEPLERACRDPVEGEAASTLPLEQAGVHEQLQVIAHRGLRKSEARV